MNEILLAYLKYILLCCAAQCSTVAYCVLNIVLCYVFCCAVLATISCCIVPHFLRGGEICVGILLFPDKYEPTVL